MRRLASALIMLPVVAVLFACESNKSASSGAQSGTQPGKAQEGKTCTMQSGGRDVLRVTAPADADWDQWDGILYLESQNRRINLWLVRGAHTVDEGVARVGQEIIGQFKDFKSTTTSTLTIAQMPAKRLLGTGVEADDGDPGTADVVVFKTGTNIFIACTHGESLSSEAQEWMLAVLQTAQAP